MKKVRGVTPDYEKMQANSSHQQKQQQQDSTSWHRRQRLCAHVAGPPSGVPGGIGTKWDRSREPATKTPRTPESLEGVVFSECGVGEPSNLSRIKLMMAGDVESNPGPPCAACNRAIRINTVPLQCGGCGGGCPRVALGPHKKRGGKGMPIRVPPLQRRTSADGGGGGGEEDRVWCVGSS